jgi:hypothetical protein
LRGCYAASANFQCALTPTAQLFIRTKVFGAKHHVGRMTASRWEWLETESNRNIGSAYAFAAHALPAWTKIPARLLLTLK